MEQGTAIPVAPKLEAILAAVLPNRLGIPYYSQSPYANLCWAACAQMVLHAKFADAGSICKLAGDALGRNCCPNPASSGCDVAEWPIPVYNALGFQGFRNGRPLSPAQVSQQIGTEQNPVQVYLLATTWAHTVLIVDVVAKGYRVYDPWLGPLDTPSIEAKYGAGTWSDTYYCIGTAKVA